MHSSVDNQQACERCGSVLDTAAPAGLCPRCLLESAARLAIGIEEDEREDSPRDTAEKDPGLPACGRLGNYELIERIAAGGMGVVYRARQIGLNRVVAIKLLPFGPFTREEFVRRFQIEAGAAARLRHPNIVTIFEVGKADGYPFFSMELVEGPTLAGLVRDQPLEVIRAVRLVRRIAEALHYAHQQGILHRDLKPSNVLLDPLDQPRITDFGLARDLSEESDLTLSGAAFGSPNFMPPEQAAGRRDEVTVRSDVYGLGAIFYHLLTGRPPFSADSPPKVLHQVLENEPLPPRQLNPSLPRDLETICLKCLEKEPGRRYASAQELAEELGRFQRGEPILAHPVGVMGRTWRWCKRRPAIAGLLALLAVAVVAGFAATFAQWRRAEFTANRLAETVTRLEIDRAEEWLQRGETSDGLAVLASVLRREPQNRVASTRLFAALSQRQFILPTDGLIQDEFVGRNSAFAPYGDWIVTATNRSRTLQLWNTANGLQLEALFASPEPVRVASFRADGKQLVAATSNGSVLVFDLPDASAGKKQGANQPQEPVAGPYRVGGYIDRIILSPDGSKAVAHLSGPNIDDWKRAKLVIVDLAADGILREESSMHWAAFSPDGKWLVTSGGRSAQLRDPLTWEPIGPELGHGGRINTAEFSRQTGLLVTASADHTARLWRVETGERVGSTMRHDLQVLSAIFSPDGKRVLTKDLGRQSQLWNGTNGSPLAQPFRQSRGISPSSFSADGKLLVTFSETKVWVWDAMTGEAVAEQLDTGHVVPRAGFIGTKPQLLTSDFGGKSRVWNLPGKARSGERFVQQGEVNALAVNSDGSLIASASSGHVTIWNPREAKQVALLSHQNRVLHVEFDPASRQLATALSDGTVRLWEMPSGRLLGEPLRHQRAVLYVGYSPDGRWLVTTSEDLTARIWEVVSLQPASPPLRHQGDVRAAAFHPGGKVVATAGTDNAVRLWRVPDGAPLGEPLRHSNRVAAVAFSPGGNLLATAGSEKGARLWEVPAWDETAGPDGFKVRFRTFLRDEGHVNSIEFDASGTRVVTASNNRMARIWNAMTGEALARPLHHADGVTWAGFSPDGRWVLTASNDGTARLWDSATGLPVADPLRHDDIVKCARWSPVGEFVVTGSYDRTVRIGRLHFLSVEQAPAWLPDLAEAIGGKRLIGDHLHAPVPPGEFLKLREFLLDQVESEPQWNWLGAVLKGGDPENFPR